MKLFDLTGRAALVTGGNRGIGLAIAKGLGSAGAAVAIAARDADKSQSAVDHLAGLGIRCRALTLDVRDPAAGEAALLETQSSFGNVDILVNCAGTTARKRPEELSYKDWRSVLETNLDAIFHLSVAAYPLMKAGGGGKIINVGSMLSIFGSPLGSAYAASKGGVVQYSRSLATAWAADNIQVNCILPGWVNTDLTRSARAQIPGLNEKVLGGTPAGRWGETQDFEGVAVFLASEASNFVTGVAIPVDGGYSVLV